MTVNEAMSCAKFKNALHGEVIVDLDELLKIAEPENLRDINRRIGLFQMMASDRAMAGETDGLLNHPTVVFSREIGSHVDGCADVVFEGLKDSSKENKHKQFLAFIAGKSYIRVIVKDIVDTKFNGSWSAFFSVIVSKTAHGYQHPEDYNQGADIKEMDENYIYDILDCRENWFKEPVTIMVANILECVAMALKEVRLVSN